MECPEEKNPQRSKVDEWSPERQEGGGNGEELLIGMGLILG